MHLSLFCFYRCLFIEGKSLTICQRMLWKRGKETTASGLLLCHWDFLSVSTYLEIRRSLLNVFILKLILFLVFLLKALNSDNTYILDELQHPPLNLGDPESGYLTEANLLSISLQIGKDWRNIGINLGLSYQELDRIQYKHRCVLWSSSSPTICVGLFFKFLVKNSNKILHHSVSSTWILAFLYVVDTFKHES